MVPTNWWKGILLMSAVFVLAFRVSDAATAKDAQKSKCPELDCDEVCQCYRYDADGCKTCDCYETMGDICLTDEQYDMINGVKEGNPHKAVSSVRPKWDNLPEANDTIYRVPYSFGDGVVGDSNGRDEINKAMGILTAVTCLKFAPLEEAESNPYINFVNGGGCSSFIGRQSSSAQSITLAPGCRDVGTILHEILHALGVFHEQSRPDRDQYVLIAYENIQQNRHSQFAKLPASEANDYGSPYDKKSLMHYGSYDFSSNGKPTILDRQTNNTILTQRDVLSAEDIFQINAHYECKGVQGIPFTTDCYHPLDRGFSYRGTQAVTSSGSTCRRWDSLPSSTRFTAEKTTGAGLEENYCRNPHADPGGPWCYVTSTTFQYCDIPVCDPAVERIGDPAPTRWSEYGAWTECMGTCGAAFQHRFRTCMNGQVGAPGCEGAVFETRSCDLTPCPSLNTTTTAPPPTTTPTPWGDWKGWGRYSSCSKPCGPGLRHRVRRCDSGVCNGAVIESVECNEGSCPLVPDGDCYDKRDRDSYRGNASEAIRRGERRECIDWEDSNTLPSAYPGKDLVGNLCRNPKNRNKPYCHITRKRIANCAVSICNTRAKWRKWAGWSDCNSPCGGGLQYRTRDCKRGLVTENRCTGEVIQERACNDNTCPATTTTPTITTPTTPTAVDCADLSDVQSYRGTISNARNGDVCQRWDSQSPNAHRFTAQDRLDYDLSENYCRAPENGDIYPYCYSSTAATRYYCDVPMCQPNPPLPLLPGSCYDRNNKQSYFGDVAMTVDGDECMRWDGNDPYVHAYKPYDYPDKGLGPHNFCRNPDNDDRPWCVTTNPGKFWNFCDVPICN